MSAESVSKQKTLEKFGNLNFGISVPQDIFKQNEDELVIQERMVAEIKKLRLENSALNEKNNSYANLLKLAEDLSAAKDQKIVLLEGIISKAEQLNSNNDKIIKNLQTELEISKQESKFLKEELDKVRKTRNKRSVIVGIIGFIAGVATKFLVL